MSELIKQKYIPSSVSEKAIEVFEQYSNFKFPEDFKEFFKRYGGKYFSPESLGYDDTCEYDGSRLSIDHFLPIRKPDQEWYESIGVIDFKQWFEDTLDFDDPEDYKVFLEIVRGDPKKRLLFGMWGGGQLLTLAEDGEVEKWVIDNDSDFEHVANSFTEFLSYFKPVKE